MAYTKIRLPKTDRGAQAFVALAKNCRVVGVREEGEVTYQVPTDALETLDKLSLPYEILVSGLSSPIGPSGQTA